MTIVVVIFVSDSFFSIRRLTSITFIVCFRAISSSTQKLFPSALLRGSSCLGKCVVQEISIQFPKVCALLVDLSFYSTH